MNDHVVKQQHTQEPWSATDYDVYAPTGVCIVNVKSTKNLPCAANAARIVACVNACAGIPTDDLQASRNAFDAMPATIRLLQQQRDELLAALQALVEAGTMHPGVPGLGSIPPGHLGFRTSALGPAFEQARAAIAKVLP